MSPGDKVEILLQPSLEFHGNTVIPHYKKLGIINTSSTEPLIIKVNKKMKVFVNCVEGDVSDYISDLTTVEDLMKKIQLKKKIELSKVVINNNQHSIPANYLLSTFIKVTDEK